MVMGTVVESTAQQELSKPVDRSDPVSFTCTCGQPGSVLLFYRYFANEPPLPETISHLAQDPKQQEDFHRQTCETNKLTGKIRASKEGFNVTVAGSHSGIASYISACLAHWSFTDLPLSTEAQQDAFFKPTPGCRCVFTSLSVRATSEITPLGVTNYSPSTWSAVIPLSPAEFHQKCLEEDVKLIDVRNHYESKIGYFVSKKGGEAIKPPVRMCQCEQERERRLWGGEKYKEVKTQGWRKKQRMAGTRIKAEQVQKGNIMVKVREIEG